MKLLLALIAIVAFTLGFGTEAKAQSTQAEKTLSNQQEVVGELYYQFLMESPDAPKFGPDVEKVLREAETSKDPGRVAQLERVMREMLKPPPLQTYP